MAINSQPTSTSPQHTQFPNVMAGELTQEEKGKEQTLSLCTKEKTQPRQNMEERNTHAVRNGRRNRTLNSIQKSGEERQQPKSWVKPTASQNRGLKPQLFHIHSRNHALEAALPARQLYVRKMNQPPPARPCMRVNRPGLRAWMNRQS